MPQPTLHDPMRDVRRWLWAIAALVAGMVMLGGATRLTGSGLSITEWNVVTGIFPPLTDAAWLGEFEKYKAIPQYQAINKGMSLADFKFIYFWEWAHRLLGRIVGFAFAIPLAFFWWRGKIDRALGWKLVLLLFLGGLQGAIGWWMVASGLSVRTDVSQYRLAVHLTLACIIFVALVWVATSLLPQRKERRARAHFRGRSDRAFASPGFSRRDRRENQCRAHLQHLAADRRRVSSEESAALSARAVVAQYFRERACGAVQSPHDGVSLVVRSTGLCALSNARQRARSRRGSYSR